MHKKAIFYFYLGLKSVFLLALFFFIVIATIDFRNTHFQKFLVKYCYGLSYICASIVFLKHETFVQTIGFSNFAPGSQRLSFFFSSSQTLRPSNNFSGVLCSPREDNCFWNDLSIDLTVKSSTVKPGKNDDDDRDLIKKVSVYIKSK